MNTEQLSALLPDGCTVIWDRGIDVGATVICYGWIEKTHRAETPGLPTLPRLYDFLLVELDKSTGTVTWWCTSAAKWSLKFQISFSGDAGNHAECVGIDAVLERITSNIENAG